MDSGSPHCHVGEAGECCFVFKHLMSGRCPSRGGMAALSVIAALMLAGCNPDAPVSGPQTASGLSSMNVPMEYRARPDGEKIVPMVPSLFLTERNKRQWVAYDGPEEPNTLIVDPYARLLYHVVEPGKAMRFGVAVGKAGRGFAGTARVQVKKEWPGWTPTQNMIRRDPELYGPLAGGLKGGLSNPLGARALYLYRGGRDTMYRIHGTMDPASIGRATSAGCIRLFNQDVMDLYDEMEIGAKVKVRSKAESIAAEGEMVELHTGYVVPATETAVIEADQKAYDEGLIRDLSLVEAEAYARSVAAAEAQAAGLGPEEICAAADAAAARFHPEEMPEEG